jgi:hypothetical protein
MDSGDVRGQACGGDGSKARHADDGPVGGDIFVPVHYPEDGPAEGDVYGADDSPVGGDIFAPVHGPFGGQAGRTVGG